MNSDKSEENSLQKKFKLYLGLNMQDVKKVKTSGH